MSDEHVRLLAGGDTTRLEREVLRAGLDVDPPVDAKAEVWAALSAQLPPLPAPAPPAGAAPASAAGIWKTVAIGFASGIVIAGTVFLADSGGPAETSGPVTAPVVAPPAQAQPESISAPATTSTAPVAEPVKPAPAAARRPIAAHESPPVEEAPAAAPAPGTLPPAAAAEPLAAQSKLSEESRLLREARGALRSGQAPRAISILEESRTKHSPMVLGQEHEALMIEALVATGSHAAAKARAQAFVARFPTSPHAAKLRSIAESP